MKILALETSTEFASIALCDDEQIWCSEIEGQRQHSVWIIPAIDALMRNAHIKKLQLDAIAFGRGPGAFTGVRLAVSVTQGIAFALGVPVIPVSCLQSIAASHADAALNDEIILSVIDARMNEVYVGAFQKISANEASSSGLKHLGEELLCAPEELFSESIRVRLGVRSDQTIRLVGNGFNAYREQLQTNIPSSVKIDSSITRPHARDILKLARSAFVHNEAVTADLALPIYLRNKVALTEAERKAK